MPDPPRVVSIRSPEGLQALCHPTRVEMLEVLREPATSAEVARQIGQPRQRINYHLKALEEAGLVEPVESRRNGNFVETLYRAIARTFVIAPEVAWQGSRRLDALRSQHALETLVALGERLQRDAAELLDRAAFDGEEIASAAVSVETKFATAEVRAAFMREFLESTKELLEKHGSEAGDPYRVVFTAHPQTEGSNQ
jgi:DNA-binding transcriptional ArsR family regulator